MTLVYVGDPVCVYCYAFGQSLTAVDSQLPRRLVVGGLRPREQRQVWSATFRAFVRPHWQRVEALVGRPMHPSLRGEGACFLDRDGFLDTELADRAVVVARTLAPELAFAMFEAISRAFYEEARDLHAPETFVVIASTLGLDASAFRHLLASEDNAASTWADFALARRWGVTGFPTLLHEHQGVLRPITLGYIDAAELQRRVRVVEETAAAGHRRPGPSHLEEPSP